jgi:hypothetical protein
LRADRGDRTNFQQTGRHNGIREDNFMGEEYVSFQSCDTDMGEGNMATTMLQMKTTEGWGSSSQSPISPLFA